MEYQLEDALGYWLFYAQRCVEYAFLEVLRQCCVEHKKAYVVAAAPAAVGPAVSVV